MSGAYQRATKLPAAWGTLHAGTGLESAVDGQQQRNALTAAEKALRSLGERHPFRAKRNAFQAADLDQVGAFTDLPKAVEMAIHDIEQRGRVTTEGWDRLAAVVGPGPLIALIDELRGPIRG